MFLYSFCHKKEPHTNDKLFWLIGTELPPSNVFYLYTLHLFFWKEQFSPKSLWKPHKCEQTPSYWNSWTAWKEVQGFTLNYLYHIHFILLQNRWGVVHAILLHKGSPLSLSGVPPTPPSFEMPTARGKTSLNARDGEKERNYLFKSYTYLE